MRLPAKSFGWAATEGTVNPPRARISPIQIYAACGSGDELGRAVAGGTLLRVNC